MKPSAESCEQNKHAIHAILTPYLEVARQVLEIGSGTGQHAVYFAREFPHLIWQTSDVPENHVGIQAWQEEASLSNLIGPHSLNVNQAMWGIEPVDLVFSANTVHIMDWPSVENMFAGIGKLLEQQGVFCLYGPFNYNGAYTSESNASFDQWLKARDANSGIRDFEALNKLADENEMTLIADHPMPSNNHTLIWQKVRVIDR